MRTVALTLALVVSAFVLSWALTLGLCAATASDALCGHNAGLPWTAFFIISLVGLPLFWKWLHRTPPTRRKPVTAQCSRCGGGVSLDASRCPACGFEFGNAA
jgi:hypothetical protein